MSGNHQPLRSSSERSMERSNHVPLSPASPTQSLFAKCDVSKKAVSSTPTKPAANSAPKSPPPPPSATSPPATTSPSSAKPPSTATNPSTKPPLASTPSSKPPSLANTPSKAKKSPSLDTASSATNKKPTSLASSPASTCKKPLSLATSPASCRKKPPPLGTSLASNHKKPPSLATSPASSHRKPPSLASSPASVRKKPPPLATTPTHKKPPSLSNSPSATRKKPPSLATTPTHKSPPPSASTPTHKKPPPLESTTPTHKKPPTLANSPSATRKKPPSLANSPSATRKKPPPLATTPTHKKNPPLQATTSSHKKPSPSEATTSTHKKHPPLEATASGQKKPPALEATTPTHKKPPPLATTPPSTRKKSLTPKSSSSSDKSPKRRTSVPSSSSTNQQPLSPSSSSSSRRSPSPKKRPSRPPSARSNHSNHSSRSTRSPSPKTQSSTLPKTRPPSSKQRTPSPRKRTVSVPNPGMPAIDGEDDQGAGKRPPLSLIDLGFLSEEERKKILDVLKRDEDLRKSEEVRVKKTNRKLKVELHELRKKAAVNPDDENRNTSGCARCHEEFGLFSSGNQCPKCKHHVCPQCQVFTPTGKRWLCVVCHKAMQIKIESGEWFYEKLEVAEKVTLFGSDLVKASLAKAKGDPSNPTKLTIDDLRPSSSAESTPRTKHRVRHRRTNSNPKDLRNYRHADSASDRDSGWSQHNGASLDASESSQRSSLHDDESHQRSSRYDDHDRGRYDRYPTHRGAPHPYPYTSHHRWEVSHDDTESISTTTSYSDITSESDGSYSRQSQDHTSLSQTESNQRTPPLRQRQARQMKVVASIHSSTGSEHINSDSEAEDTTEASTGFKFTRVSVKKLPSTPTRDVFGTSLEPTIEEQDSLQDSNNLVRAFESGINSLQDTHSPVRTNDSGINFLLSQHRPLSPINPYRMSIPDSPFDPEHPKLIYMYTCTTNKIEPIMINPPDIRYEKGKLDIVQDTNVIVSYCTNYLYFPQQHNGNGNNGNTNNPVEPSQTPSQSPSQSPSQTPSCSTHELANPHNSTSSNASIHLGDSIDESEGADSSDSPFEEVKCSTSVEGYGSVSLFISGEETSRNQQEWNLTVVPIPEQVETQTLNSNEELLNNIEPSFARTRINRVSSSSDPGVDETDSQIPPPIAVDGTIVFMGNLSGTFSEAFVLMTSPKDDDEGRSDLDDFVEALLDYEKRTAVVEVEKDKDRSASFQEPQRLLSPPVACEGTIPVAGSTSGSFVPLFVTVYDAVQQRKMVPDGLEPKFTSTRYKKAGQAHVHLTAMLDTKKGDPATVLPVMVDGSTGYSANWMVPLGALMANMVKGDSSDKRGKVKGLDENGSDVGDQDEDEMNLLTSSDDLQKKRTLSFRFLKDDNTVPDEKGLPASNAEVGAPTPVMTDGSTGYSASWIMPLVALIDKQIRGDAYKDNKMESDGEGEDKDGDGSSGDIKEEDGASQSSPASDLKKSRIFSFRLFKDDNLVTDGLEPKFKSSESPVTNDEPDLDILKIQWKGLYVPPEPCDWVPPILTEGSMYLPENKPGTLSNLINVLLLRPIDDTDGAKPRQVTSSASVYTYLYIDDPKTSASVQAKPDTASLIPPVVSEGFIHQPRAQDRKKFFKSFWNFVSGSGLETNGIDHPDGYGVAAGNSENDEREAREHDGPEVKFCNDQDYSSVGGEQPHKVKGYGTVHLNLSDNKDSDPESSSLSSVGEGNKVSGAVINSPGKRKKLEVDEELMSMETIHEVPSSSLQFSLCALDSHGLESDEELDELVDAFVKDEIKDEDKSSWMPPVLVEGDIYRTRTGPLSILRSLKHLLLGSSDSDDGSDDEDGQEYQVMSTPGMFDNEELNGSPNYSPRLNHSTDSVFESTHDTQGHGSHHTKGQRSDQGGGGASKGLPKDLQNGGHTNNPTGNTAAELDTSDSKFVFVPIYIPKPELSKPPVVVESRKKERENGQHLIAEIRQAFGSDLSSDSEESNYESETFETIDVSKSDLFETIDVSGDSYVHVVAPDKDNLSLIDLDLDEDFGVSSPDFREMRLHSKYMCNTQLMESLMEEARQSPSHRSKSEGDIIDIFETEQSRPLRSQSISVFDSHDGVTYSDHMYGNGHIFPMITVNESPLSNTVNDNGTDDAACEMTPTNELTEQDTSTSCTCDSNCTCHSSKLLIVPSVNGNLWASSESSDSESDNEDDHHHNMAIKHNLEQGQLRLNGMHSSELSAHYLLPMIAAANWKRDLSTDDNLSVIAEESETERSPTDVSPRMTMGSRTSTPKQASSSARKNVHVALESVKELSCSDSDRSVSSDGRGWEPVDSYVKHHKAKQFRSPMDHLVPAASAAPIPDASHISSGHHTPQRSRAGSGTERSRTGSTAGRSRTSSSPTAGRSHAGSIIAPTLHIEGASNGKENEGVNADEVDARLKLEVEKGPEILVHEIQPTPETEDPDTQLDDDIDRYLASTSTANTTANNTLGATRSLSLTPSSAHGESRIGDDVSPNSDGYKGDISARTDDYGADLPSTTDYMTDISRDSNGQANGGSSTISYDSYQKGPRSSYASSVSSRVSSHRNGHGSPERSYGRYTSEASSFSAESTLSRKIQKPMLHKGSSTSLTSLYSEAGEHYGKFPITGDIQFSMSYNYKIGLFEIKIINCRDLAPIDTKKNKSDPYVKTYLLPDKTKNGKRKTRVKRGTINPMFEETIKYTISQSELQTRTLNVSVWNRDAFGRNTFLGEVLMPLDTVSLDSYKPTWHPLCNKSPPQETSLSYKGDIIVALRFEPAALDPHESTDETPPSPEKTKSKKKSKKKSDLISPTKKSTGWLHVNVKEAKNLMAVRMNGSSNPFVKCYLEPDRSKQGKRKTNVIKNNLNPSWNYQLSFGNVTLKSLKERCLELTVWDYDTIGSNDFLGGIRLGKGTGLAFGKKVDWMDSTSDEIRAWANMLRTPGEWTEATLTLRPNMNTKAAT